MDEAAVPAHGYADLTADHAPAPHGPAQALMQTRLLPLVYERWWRPALGRLVKGPRGPSMAGEVRLLRGILDLQDGELVLDVACGPGNLTRAFADDVGADGTVIGVDVAAGMLARAVADTTAGQVVYVRADVADLRVRAGSVDAVCCFAALHLFSDPGAALDVMTDALAPGGRLALLTSVRPANPWLARLAELAGRMGGTAVFGADDLARQLARRGLEVTDHHVFGAMQLVGARRPAARPPGPADATERPG